MRRKYFLTLLLCGSLLLSLLMGCKSSKKTVSTVTTGGVKSQVEFLESMERQSFQFETMTARLNVELAMGKQELSSRVDLKMVKDSLLHLSIVPLLGIEIFRIELTQDTIRVMDRMNKHYLIENYAELKGQTPIAFNFHNLQALFTNHLFIPGESSVSPEHYNRFKLSQDGSMTEIKIKDAMGLLYTFTADAEEKLLSTHASDEKEQYALNWEYADFRAVEEQLFPMLMDVNILKEGSSVGGMKISYSRIQLNEPIKANFNISAKYRRITFAEMLKSTKNSLSKKE